jgi:hypothetical protein
MGNDNGIREKILRAWFESDILKYRLKPYGIALNRKWYECLLSELQAIQRQPENIMGGVTYLSMMLPSQSDPVPVFLVVNLLEEVRFLI